jgi:hypothetical protein
MMRTRVNKLNKGPKFLASFMLLILSLSLCACGGGGGGGFGFFGFGVAPTISISPKTANVTTGTSLPFAVSITGLSDRTVIWSVNGITGGDATHGTIDPAGVYTAPAAVPTPDTVTVTATCKANLSLSASATVKIVPLALGAGTNYSGVFLNISGSLKYARSNHTATSLPTTISAAVPTGYTLVAGGIGDSGASIDKAELFNPAARGFGHFTSVGSMTKPRAYHAATRLQSGLVLLTGGVDDKNTPLASAEIFNPASGSFAATGSMTTPRCMHTATLLANGKVLIAGGNGSASFDGGVAIGSAELFDPATGTFTLLAKSMIQPRYYHTATLQQDGKVLLAGGQGLGGQKLADTELFDPVTATFAATTGNMMVDPTVDTGRWLHTAMLLSDGTTLMVGGDGGTISGQQVNNYLNSGQVYSPATGVFTDLVSTLTYARGLHAAAMRADNKVLFAGGIGDTGNPDPLAVSGFLNSAEVYDVAGVAFALTGSMNFVRANHTATALTNGKIIVIGGNNGGAFLKSAELYQ